jgi:hypothetical protein
VSIRIEHHQQVILDILYHYVIMTCGTARFFRLAPQTMPVFGTIHLLASKSTARGQSLLGQNIRPLKPLESALMDLLLIKIFKLSGMNTYRNPGGG